MMRSGTESTSRGLALNAVVVVAYIVLGVAVGQLAAWIVRLVAAFANITGLVAAILGDGVAIGLIFVVGTCAYAIVVGIATSAGLSLLTRTDDPGDAEAWAGVVAGAAAFLLTSWLAEPYVRFVISAAPAAAKFIANATGVMGLVAGILLQAIPVSLVALGAYGFLRFIHRPARVEQSQR